MTDDVRLQRHVDRRRIMAKMDSDFIRLRYSLALLHDTTVETTYRLLNLGVMLEVERMWDDA